MDFPFLLDFIIISVSQMAMSNLSVSETAEIMENIQAAPNPGGELCYNIQLNMFSFHFGGWIFTQHSYTNKAVKTQAKLNHSIYSTGNGDG